MIRHVLKLMWNRKRQNALVLVELVGSQLVLVALFAAMLGAYENWRRPVGFDPEHLWTVSAQAADPESTAPDDLILRLLEAAREQPSVAVAGAMLFPLYTDSGITHAGEHEGQFLIAERVPVSPGADRALGLELSQGRFFTDEDRGGDSTPAVLNRAFAEAYFGAQADDAVGRTVELGNPLRVVGVVDSFRKAGELSAERLAFFTPLWPDEPLRFGLVSLALRMAPGTPPAAQQRILERLQAEAPDWSFDMAQVTEQRRQHLERGVTPFAAGGMVAAFLLIMVGLGLTGVLWQNISRRTAEIGLRRAQGATASDIRRQIGLELLTLTLASLVVGALLTIQLPILGLVDIEPALFLKVFMLAGAVLILVTAACGFYPSRLAATIQPAEALHHSS